MPRYSSIQDVFASYDARFQPEKAKGEDATVVMDLSGDNAAQRTLYVNDGTFRMEDGVQVDDPKLRLEAKADDWLAIENGEMNPMMAVMTRKIKMKGDMPFAMKFMSFFGGKTS